jgi:hypothetical protein
VLLACSSYAAAWLALRASASRAFRSSWRSASQSCIACTGSPSLSHENRLVFHFLAESLPAQAGGWAALSTS